MATQETIKQLFSGGVLRDIEDVDARQAITALQNALNALTSGDTTTAIENFQEVIDFLDGVTDDETLIGKITALQTAINGKQPMLTFDNVPTAGSNNPVKSGGVKTALDAKVNTETGKGLSTNDYTTAEKTKLAGIESGAEANVNADWNASSGDAKILNKPTIPSKTSDLTKDDVYTKSEVDNAISNASQGESIVTSLDNVAIIDDNFTSPTVLAAPSAREIREIYLNLKALYDNLAGIAFTSTAPTWQTVAKSSFNLTTSLTDCTSSIQSGDAGSGKVYEGAVVVRLTPTTDYAFSSIAVTKTSGGNSVTFTQSAGAGYVDITFVCTEAVTITATAISGYGVSLASGSNCYLSPASVTPNATYNGVLSPNQHYTLPSSISATMGGSPITFGGNSGNSYDSSTGAIVISNVTGAVVITASASLMQSIVVTLDGTNVVFKHGTDTLTGSVTLYEDDKPYVINVKPQSGYSMTAPTAAGCTIEPDGDDGYNVIIPTTVTSALTITASASIPTTLELNTKWFQAPATEPTIEAGTRFELELTPLTNFVAAADQAALTANNGAISISAGEVKAAVQVLMNNVDITEDSGVVTFDKINNKVSINIANPNGAVIINATARLKIAIDRYTYSDATIQDHSAAKGWGAIKGTIPIPKSLLNSDGNANEIYDLYEGFGAVNNNAYCVFYDVNNSYNVGGTNIRDKAAYKNYAFDGSSMYNPHFSARTGYTSAIKFKFSVYLSVALDITSDSGLPFVKGRKNGGEMVEIISKDDFSYALYVAS